MSALRAFSAGLVCGVAFVLQACASAPPPAPHPLAVRPMTDFAVPPSEWEMSLGDGKEVAAKPAADPKTTLHPMVASDGKKLGSP
jgi:hypothetical protein